MSHATGIERFPGTLADLANEVGDLRYDALAAFLESLAAKLQADAREDGSEGREQLASALDEASQGVRAAADSIGKAWRVCEPHM